MREELKLFLELVEQLLEDEEKNPVSRPIDPGELSAHLDLSLSEEPALAEDFKKKLSQLVLSTPKTSTRLFFNQLFGGRQPKAVLGDLLAVLLNNSMYTYKVAGPQVGVEREIISQVCRLVGYGSGSGGTLPTGGSMSNFMALLMARDVADNESKNKGISRPLVAYTSKESHYSIGKNASFSGLGREQVRYIQTNSAGEMLPDKLEEQIVEDLKMGQVPFFVNATAGTTVLGAFDPLGEIGRICKKYQCWLHVDGAYCGGVIFSRKHRHLVRGVEEADSFCFNAHKMLGTPLVCSVLVVKDQMKLRATFDNEASYLYQTASDDYNLGKTSFQCGRKNDALKFWTLWKALGTRGLEEMVDHQFYLANVARAYIKNNIDYTLYSGDDSLSVCFTYKDFDAAALCQALYEHAQTLVGYGTFQQQEFIRLVTINANNKEEEIYSFFKVIEQFAEKQKNTLKKISLKKTA